MYPKPGICSAAVSPVHMHQRLALATRASCASRLWRVGRLCGPLRKSTCRTLAQPRPSRFYMSAVGSSAIDNSSAQDSGYSQSDSHVAEDLVQYIVLRKDLWTSLNWPLGSIIAQACHASTAALWLSRDTPTTSAYCALPNLDDMHKVVLEVKGEQQLHNLSSRLHDNNIAHKLWVEQPEDFPTCLATAPCSKIEVQQHFKKFQLCKGI